MIIGGIVFAELVFLARCNASLKEIQGAKPVAVAEEGSIVGLTEAVLSMGIPLALIAIGIYYMEIKPKAADGRRSRDAPDEPPYSGPQLAGGHCIHCREKIVSHLSAAVCKACEQPVHLDCRKAHRADAHAKPARAAYR